MSVGMWSNFISPNNDTTGDYIEGLLSGNSIIEGNSDMSVMRTVADLEDVIKAAYKQGHDGQIDKLLVILDSTSEVSFNGRKHAIGFSAGKLADLVREIAAKEVVLL